MTDVVSRLTSPFAPFDVDNADRLLTTTRAVRLGLDLDRPVEREVVEECLEVAVHAPTASNLQTWRWICVTDPEKKARIAEIYGWGWTHYKAMSGGGRGRRFARRKGPDPTLSSADWLAQNLHRVPVLVFPCVLGRPPKADEINAFWAEQADANPRDGVPAPTEVGLVQEAVFFGSIYPAVWSLQLALHSRGLGSAITSMHLPFEPQVAELLGIPSAVTQTCMVPIAYLRRGPMTEAPRKPAKRLTYWDEWNATAP
jgi:nitroreductase